MRTVNYIGNKIYVFKVVRQHFVFIYCDFCRVVVVINQTVYSTFCFYVFFFFCFCFSFLRRDPNGKLHLVQDIGRIPLVNTKLIEDPSDNHTDEDGKLKKIIL